LQKPGFDPISVYVTFEVDKVALRQVSLSENFGFALSVSFHKCSILHLHLHLHVALTRKTKRAKPRNLPNAILFWKLGSTGYKSAFTWSLKINMANGDLSGRMDCEQ
jgi:hypothetical protein